MGIAYCTNKETLNTYTILVAGGDHLRGKYLKLVVWDELLRSEHNFNSICTLLAVGLCQYCHVHLITWGLTFYTTSSADVFSCVWFMYSDSCRSWGTNSINSDQLSRLLHSNVSKSPPPLWSSGQSSRLHNGDVLFPVRYELNLYMLCRRK
jgi:hypothetical protein